MAKYFGYCVQDGYGDGNEYKCVVLPCSDDVAMKKRVKGALKATTGAIVAGDMLERTAWH